MEKAKILKKLIENLKKELDGIKGAYDSTHSHMTDDDLKSEGKYDTRGIEAGYLAGAQKVRLEEMEQDIQMLEEVPVREFSSEDEVGIGALVELLFKGKRRKYYISPVAGGTLLEIDGEGILVISVFSPIGAEALGLKVGDEFELESQGEVREYKVCSLL